MARKPRYHNSGALYHVMLRGNGGQKIFFSDEDRCRMSLLIQHGVERYGHRIHAFCFMSNHIHLLVQVNHVSISKIVHNLAFRYCQYINKRYSRVGHLFQGRFKAILLDENGYFLRLVRYIHMNPIRAKLVNEPTEYQWSSHRAYLGQENITWLTFEYALAKFDNIIGSARRLYDDYVLKKESTEELDELRSNFRDGQVLGNDNFLENIRERNGQESKQALPIAIGEIVDAACAVFGIEKPMLSSVSQSRRVCFARGAIVLYAREQGTPLDEIAVVLKRDVSTLSSLQSRLLAKCSVNYECRQEIEKLKSKVRQLADLQA